MELDRIHAGFDQLVVDPDDRLTDEERWLATHLAGMVGLLQEFVPEYLELRERVIADDGTSEAVADAAFVVAGVLAVPLQRARRRPDLIAAGEGELYDLTEALWAMDLLLQSVLLLTDPDPEVRALAAEPDELQQLLDMPMLRAFLEAAADE